MSDSRFLTPKDYSLIAAATKGNSISFVFTVFHRQDNDKPQHISQFSEHFSTFLKKLENQNNKLRQLNIHDLFFKEKSLYTPSSLKNHHFFLITLSPDLLNTLETVDACTITADIHNIISSFLSFYKIKSSAIRFSMKNATAPHLITEAKKVEIIFTKALNKLESSSTFTQELPATDEKHKVVSNLAPEKKRKIKPSLKSTRLPEGAELSYADDNCIFESSKIFLNSESVKPSESKLPDNPTDSLWVASVFLEKSDPLQSSEEDQQDLTHPLLKKHKVGSDTSEEKHKPIVEVTSSSYASISTLLTQHSQASSPPSIRDTEPLCEEDFPQEAHESVEYLASTPSDKMYDDSTTVDACSVSLNVFPSCAH